MTHQPNALHPLDQPALGSRSAAQRRRLLSSGLGMGLAGAAALAAGWPLRLQAQPAPPNETGVAMRAAIRAWTQGAPLRDGKVGIDIAELIDNGNAVPVTLSVASPMTAADHVTALALFAERNPLPEVVAFRLGPRAGRAEVATRIRLATSQQLVAIARLNDGTCWQHSVKVIVTLAACVEDPTEGS
jgi:sulfur-oxidizing protein SoxY